MSELKTLKDLVGKNDECDKGKSVDEVFFYGEDLRQEAIKELKIIDNPLVDLEFAKILGLTKLCKTCDEIQTCLFGVRRFLIWKYNLTEEDLKDE